MFKSKKQLTTRVVNLEIKNESLRQEAKLLKERVDSVEEQHTNLITLLGVALKHCDNNRK